MKKWIAGQKGQQVILIALLMPVLLACLGLVVDVGNVYAHRRKAQSAADAAATAAGIVLYQQGHLIAEATALYYAAQNGYNNDRTTNLVDPSSPPSSGTYINNSSYIQVQITDNVAPIFASIVWNGTFTVRARATAGYTVVGKGPPIIILNEVLCRALDQTGSATLRVYNGFVHINSGCANALNQSGSGSIITAYPSTIHGGFNRTGSGIISPTPITGAPVLPDPLISLPVPNLGSYTVQNGTPANPQTKSIPGSGSVTLNPGIYYGGIKISGSGPVTLNPGVYIMAGTGFIVSGSGRITGRNVFLYITEDPTNRSGAGAMGKWDVSGSGPLDMTAPNSGTYAGILVFYDRTNTNRATMTGSAAWTGATGVVYLKKAKLDLSGSGASIYATFVIDSMDFSGSGILATYGYSGPGWQTIDSILSE
jgi:Flp pilus assembly protein TadG